MNWRSLSNENEKLRCGHVGFIDIEVGVNFLHVVVVFHGFHQAQHLLGATAFQLDVVLRDHRHFGDLRFDAGGFDCGLNAFKVLRLSDDLNVIFIVTDVVRAGFNSDVEQLFFGPGGFVDHDVALFFKQPTD